MTESAQNTQSATSATYPRPAWQSPRLSVLGDVASLTEAGSAGSAENSQGPGMPACTDGNRGNPMC